MIDITIYQNQEHAFIGFQTKGHAEAGEPGEDVVCAAVSMLIINTVNAIEAFTENAASYLEDEEQGIIDYSLKGKITEEAQLLMSAMVLGLEQIFDDETYSDFIDLTFEEV